MKAWKEVTSLVAPVPIKDVDTDMIIPAQFLTSTSREGFGPALFSRLKQTLPEFYMNQARFAGVKVLVADTNFGCGSSREHAVWALQGAGISCVIAPSFADIFSGNSAKNGLLLVTLPDDVVKGLLQEAESGSLQVTVNLEQQTVRAADGREWSFSYDPFRKHCVLNGLDDLDYLRSKLEDINVKKGEQAQNWFFRSDLPNR